MRNQTARLQTTRGRVCHRDVKRQVGPDSDSVSNQATRISGSYDAESDTKPDCDRQIVPGARHLSPHRTGEGLMLEFMTPKSPRFTQQMGLVTFWSRSPQQLWTKGEIPGNRLRFVGIYRNCYVLRTALAHPHL